MSRSLKSFLAALAIDPDALARFLRDADAAMAAAGIADEDRELVRKGDLQGLRARLAIDPGEVPRTGSLAHQDGDGDQLSNWKAPES